LSIPCAGARRVSLVVVGLLVLAAAGGYFWQRPLLLTGTGYAAHNACALAAIAGRGDPEADLPPNPLVPVLRTATRPEGRVGGGDRVGG
jgi:hypothetical protein